MDKRWRDLKQCSECRRTMWFVLIEVGDDDKPLKKPFWICAGYRKAKGKYTEGCGHRVWGKELES